MNFRRAAKNDLPFIVKMMANDKLGKLRENYQGKLRVQIENVFVREDVIPIKHSNIA